jgi:hypothetical protein
VFYQGVRQKPQLPRFPPFQFREPAGNITFVSIFIVKGETVRPQTRYIIHSAVQAAPHAVQSPIGPIRNDQITPSEIEIIQGFPDLLFGYFEGVAGHGMKVYRITRAAGLAAPPLCNHIGSIYRKHAAAF